MNVTRLAEDASTQLDEAERWLDSADLVLMAALDGENNFTLAQAAENAIAAHSRIRRHLALVRVAA
jgi:hypothetical protein